MHWHTFRRPCLLLLVAAARAAAYTNEISGMYAFYAHCKLLTPV
jgi:hypothetical protein